VNVNETLTKYLAIALAIVLTFSPFFVRPAAADTTLNLPTTPVMIEVFNATTSYFETQLSNITTGYDVANGTYPGWCVDTRMVMERSPATHEVSLYSSVGAPGNLSSQRWDMVNYILNHKQGNDTDIQQALWYFVHFDGNYTPSTPTAQAIINDAAANGTGFIPAYGQTMAVICYPSIMFPSQPDFQISIIEIANPVIPEYPTAYILPLLMLPALITVLIYARKQQRNSTL
jgi:hypothetical protein